MTTHDPNRCPMCGTGTMSPTQVEQTVLAEDGVSLPYVDELMACDSCQERLYTPRQARESSRTRAGVLREHSGFLRPDEIRALRERFHLTQADLERLLGTARKTVVRWESGAVCQNRTADTVLRLMMDVPGVLEDLARRTALPPVAARAAVGPAPDWRSAMLASRAPAGRILQLQYGGALHVATSRSETFPSINRVRESFADADVVQDADLMKDVLAFANADYALAS